MGSSPPQFVFVSCRVRREEKRERRVAVNGRSSDLAKNVTTSSPAEPHTASADASASSTLKNVRTFVLALFAIGVVGTAADLLLTGHIDGGWQLVPVVLLVTSALTLAWHLIRPSRSSLRFHQGLMVLFIISGLVGTFLHYQANIEFELEMYPGSSGFGLIWKAIQGASPPSLAPGAMIGLGLLGLIYTYRNSEPTHADDRTGATT